MTVRKQEQLLSQRTAGVAVVKTADLEERIRNLEARLYEMEIRFRRAETVDGHPKKASRIPHNITFFGITKGRMYTLVSSPEGFRVGNTVYKSLSAAAEGVSGVRRSGWTFWRLADGRTAKEAFNK